MRIHIYIYICIYTHIYIYIYVEIYFGLLYKSSKPPLFVDTKPGQITCVNTMAAGLRYCDRALTVSPSYAVECCTDPEKGGLVDARSSAGKFQRMARVKQKCIDMYSNC